MNEAPPAPLLTSPPEARSAIHLPALDGFRGLAVLLVLLSHFLEVGGALHQTSWGKLLLGGFVGVDMFFVLSGFLITGILLDSGIGRPGSFRAFYARRLLRIFPLYYAALAIAFGLGTYPPQGDSPWWYLLFASNLGATLKGWWLTSPAGFDLGHFWSLAVEEQFYLVWPFLVAWLPRGALKKLCLACLVLGPAIHFALHFSGNPVGGYLFTPVRLHTLAAGAWLAIAAREPDRWATLLRYAPPTAWIAGALSLAGLLWPGRISLVPFSPFLWGAILVMAAEPASRWARALATRPLIFFGKLSYGLYVLHFLAFPLLRVEVYDRRLVPAFGDGAVSLLLFNLIAFALSLSAALVSWHLLEKPLLALKRYFPYPRAEEENEGSIASKTPPPSSLPPS